MKKENVREHKKKMHIIRSQLLEEGFELRRQERESIFD